ncbi:putative ribonuclease H-like domain-containing protein [Tanacetum coccineum]
MTRNKCYLDEYEDYDGGLVSFGDGKGRISGKRKIKIGTLDFKDLYFCKEFKYNLFSVSQICDKKNNVLFTKTPNPLGSVLVLFILNFKLLDESQVLLKVPRKDNIYSVDLKSVVPTRDLTCLIAKAIINESNTWHRRRGHINLKTMNRLVKGIKREFSVAKTHQQNGVAERKNRTLIKDARIMTPYELIRGRPLLIDFMKPFGCPVAILNTMDHLGKFEGKADEGSLLGTKLMVLQEPKITLLQVKLKRKKNLNKNIPICTTDPLISQGPKDRERNTRIKPIEVDENEASDISVKDDEATRSKLERLNQREMQTENTNNTNGINTVSTPISTTRPTVDTTVPSPPVNTIRPSVDNANAFEEHLFERFSPFKNAFPFHLSQIYLQWIILESLEMLMMMKMWKKKRNPKGAPSHGRSKLGGSNAENKKDERGIVVKKKARLVAQGHTQEEVFQIDVKNAFLYEKIEEEVYVCQPPGFEDPHFPNKVYKLEKELYGLHQDPRAWYETLSTYLLDNGFHRAQIDKTLFIRKHKDDILLVQVYVDDIIFGSTKKEMSTEFETLMHDKFQMSSMGELSFFLGLQVKQKSDGIFISQDKYAAEILKKFDFASVKTANTPIETNKALIKDEEAEDVGVHLYRSMIGSLMYQIASRLDIMFVVCACARFQVTPKTSHFNVVKRIFRYLKGQPKLGLWYLRDSPFNLEAFSDSDYAGASLDMKSTTRCCQFLGKRLISWQCKKQTIVANSTTKA